MSKRKFTILDPDKELLEKQAAAERATWNINIDGDEARILLQLIMSKDNSFNGNILDKVINLRNKLWDLHLNQPPKEVGK